MISLKDLDFLAISSKVDIFQKGDPSSPPSGIGRPSHDEIDQSPWSIDESE